MSTFLESWTFYLCHIIFFLSDEDWHQYACVTISCLVLFCSTGTWTQGLHFEPLHQPFFVLCILEIGSHALFARLASNLNPPDVCLLSSQDYRREPPVPGFSCLFYVLLFPTLFLPLWFNCISYKHVFGICFFKSILTSIDIYCPACLFKDLAEEFFLLSFFLSNLEDIYSVCILWEFYLRHYTCVISLSKVQM
jgi:hypothetical protein